jgi:TatA/E family protein of Tat protein translocase
MYVSLAFFSGAPGMGELLLLFVLILLLFGPKRLPEVARMLGKALDEMRRASNEFRNQIMRLDEPAPGESEPILDADGDGFAYPDGVEEEEDDDPPGFNEVEAEGAGAEEEPEEGPPAP